MNIPPKDLVYSLLSFTEYTLSHTHPSELSPNIFLQCYFARTLIRPLLDNKMKTCQNVMPVEFYRPDKKQEPDRATGD